MLRGPATRPSSGTSARSPWARRPTNGSCGMRSAELRQPEALALQQPTWVFTSRSLPTSPRGHPVRQRGRPAGASRDGGGGGRQEHLDRRRGRAGGPVLRPRPSRRADHHDRGGDAGRRGSAVPACDHDAPAALVSVTPYGEAFAELRYEVPRPSGQEFEPRADAGRPGHEQGRAGHRGRGAETTTSPVQVPLVHPPWACSCRSRP